MATTISTTQYSAVRNGGVGIIDLSSRARILVSGSEAVMFLNGLITNDMKTLALNQWMPAAFANVQGRLLAAVRIFHREDGFLIDTESATRETVITLLERFTLAGDFQVSNLTAQTTMVSVQGTRAASVVRNVLGEEAAAVERHNLVEALIDDDRLTIIRATHTAEDGFDILIEATNASNLQQRFTAAGALPVSEVTFEVLRIEAGIPLYGIDMDETNVVTETNLDDVVSFTKGCYLGQEIIVRIKHRGHVAKKLTGLLVNSHDAVPRSSKVLSTDEKEIGRVTSSTFSPRLDRGIALAYLKYDYQAPGTKVKLVTAEREFKGEVASLPLVRGSWFGGSPDFL